VKTSHAEREGRNDGHPDIQSVTNARNRTEKATARLHHAARDVNANVEACTNAYYHILHIAFVLPLLFHTST